MSAQDPPLAPPAPTSPGRRRLSGGSAIAALRALSWDAEAARALAGPGRVGHIQAVFARAVNYVGVDGKLWSVVASEHGDAPATLVVALPAHAGFDELGLRPGAAARRQEAWLWLGAGEVRVDLAGAARWQPARRPFRGCPGARGRLAQGLAGLPPRGGLDELAPHAALLLAGGQTPAGLGVLAGHCWPRLWALLAAWRAADVAGVEGAARALAGLGPGLTPAADDLLVGLLVAYRWGRGGAMSPRDESLVAACLAGCQGRTTTLSLARLEHAARGAVAAWGEAVLLALWSGDRVALESALKRAAAVGHTSGVDTLAGLLVGLALSES